MATFPSLKPATRTFTPGRHPHSEIPVLSGLQTRVRTSNVLLDQRLRLTFSALTEAEMLSIRSHYLGQQGRFLSFTIPNDLLSGTSNPSSFTPTGYSWIYADRPRITDIGLQRYDVAVELATVPPEGATLNGAELTVAATLAAGAASVELPALGTVTISFAPGAASGGVATDPNFSSVSLLLHMDGSNGSTTFTDNSINGLTITPAGNAQISTAQSQFGGASALFDGTGDYISMPYSSIFAFGSNNFTIECWLYRTGVNAANASRIWSAGGDFYHQVDISIDSTGNIASYGTTTGISWNAWAAASITSIPLNTWRHIALVRNGGTVTMYVNGTGTVLTSSLSTTALVTGTSGASVRTIGGQPGVDRAYFGYIDEFRVTNGIARYTANFTPPTAAFPNS